MRKLVFPVLIAVAALHAAAFAIPVNDGTTPLQQMFVAKEVKPGLERVGIIWSEDAASDDALAEINKASVASGVKVIHATVKDLKDVAPRFRDLLGTHKIQMLWIVKNDGVVDAKVARQFLIKTATEARIPILAPSADWVNEGASLSLRSSGGAIQLVVNKVAAEAMSLKVPEKYLERTEFLAAN